MRECTHECESKYEPKPEPEVTECGDCGLQWCGRCDPTHGPLCHRCHGRGYTTAPIRYRDIRFPEDCEHIDIADTLDGAVCRDCGAEA